MARRIGLIGQPNTGKSFSRTFIEDVSDCFVISPSDKDAYLRNGDKPAKALDLTIKGEDYRKVAKDKKLSVNQLIKAIVTSPPPDMKVSGHHVFVADLNYIETYIKFINDYMPHIKNLFIADFTHLISDVVTSKAFMRRNSGGQAFARYTDLAADALNNVFKAIGGLRDDLLVITEFHAQMGEDDFYDVFLTAGKMLKDKFLPKSYFDIMLCTHVLPYDDNIEVAKDRYKFVVEKIEPFDARTANLFSDEAIKGMIPNDMGLVLKKIRKYYNI